MARPCDYCYACRYCRFESDFVEGDTDSEDDAWAKLERHIAAHHACKHCPFTPPVGNYRGHWRCFLQEHENRAHAPCTNCGTPLGITEDHRTSKQCVHNTRVKNWSDFKKAWDDVLTFPVQEVPIAEKKTEWDHSLCLMCEETFCHEKGYEAHQDYIEHLRRCKRCYVDIRRPGPVEYPDSHGWVWYCFSCEELCKDHRSFASSQNFADHLQSVHGILKIGSKAYCREVDSRRYRLCGDGW